MRDLRNLRGAALAVGAWALVALCWLVPAPATAAPQAPNQGATITLTVGGGTSLSFKGTLSVSSSPIAGATVVVALDGQAVAQATTDATGSYTASTALPSSGDHQATAVYAGTSSVKGDTATVKFTVQSASKAPAPSAAPTSTAPAGTTISAQLSPNPVQAGSVLTVTGTLTSNGVPVDSARLDISCSAGGDSAMSVTDAKGGFSATLSVAGTTVPGTTTVTVVFLGDSRFSAARSTFQATVAAAPTPTPSTLASTAPTPTATATAGATHESSAAAVVTTSHSDDSSLPRTVGIVFAIVALWAFGALCILWVLAWQRHELLPGERRGFGSDFGRKRSA